MEVIALKRSTYSVPLSTLAIPSESHTWHLVRRPLPSFTLHTARHTAFTQRTYYWLAEISLQVTVTRREQIGFQLLKMFKLSNGFKNRMIVFFFNTMKNLFCTLLFTTVNHWCVHVYATTCRTSRSDSDPTEGASFAADVAGYPQNLSRKFNISFFFS